MAPEIQLFKSLQETFRAMNLDDSLLPGTGEFAIIDLKHALPHYPFSSPGFRPNYFSFLFVKDASATYKMDDSSFDLLPGTIFFTNPGHFRSFVWHSIEEVYLVAFSEAFLKKNTHSDVFGDFPFLISETVDPRTLSPQAFAPFELMYRQLADEFRTESKYKYKIVAHLLVVLLLKIREAFWNDYNPVQEGNKSSRIVKQFKLNLESHFRELVNGQVERQMRISDYAGQLNLHETYLSAVIKTKTGKPIRQWITERMITEAKLLLQHSESSIKEIAFKLGFLETTHFSNYFKKHASVSPADFRKSTV
ncbi:MAG: helix-turn-helix transcriptional regulator [Chitinophagaceae bacterium]